MPDNNEQKTAPQQVRYDVQYNRDRKTVLLWVQGSAMIEMPFDIFKKFYYAMNELHKSSQRIIPVTQMPPNLRS